MKKGILIRDIMPNTEITGIFVIVNPLSCQSRNGPYWRMSLTDKTGCIEGKIWAPKSLEYASIPHNEPVLLRGRASLFREQPQIAIETLTFLDQNEKAEIDQNDFLATCARDPQEMMEDLKAICMEEFQHLPWRKFVLDVLNDPIIGEKFKACPAAKNIHHAWLGGLLEHTLGVARICMQLASLYPELDRQTLLAGAIFHDLGKIREFSCDFAIDYTDEGTLEGHAYLGLEMLMPHMRKSRLEQNLIDHFKHLILSHHGTPEYGAVKIPQTMEAFILHFADNIDARITQCKQIFQNENLRPGEWSGWQKSLERKIYRAQATPKGKNANKDKRTARDEVCLSLLKE